MVELDTRPCGVVSDKKTAALLLNQSPLILRVLSMYSCNVKVGHMFCFLRKVGKKYCKGTNFHWATKFRGFCGFHFVREI